jgi:acetylornithine deacetylase
VIDRKQLLDQLDARAEDHLVFLEELIRRDTTNINHGIDGGHEANGQALIEETMRRLHMDIDRFAPSDDVLRNYPEASLGHDYSNRENLVGLIKGSGGGRSLLLNGHIDTMPFDALDQWSTHPLQPLRRDGKLFGRGACDMKAGLAGMLMALKGLVDLGFYPAGDILFESVVDEEGGGGGTIAAIDRGYRADLAIVAEPTELRIMPAHVGWVFYKVTIAGKALHSGLKWRGVNAIEKMVGLIGALQELERKLAEKSTGTFFPPATLNIGTIQGGMAGSVVPDRCTLDFGFHFPVELADEKGGGEQLKGEVVDCIDRFVKSDPWLMAHPPDLRLYQEGSAYQMPDHERVSTLLSDAKRYVTGTPASIGGCAYGCDARLLQHYGNTDTLLFGPGSIERAHSIDEYVEMDQYLAFIKIMALLILEWTGE